MNCGWLVGARRYAAKRSSRPCSIIGMGWPASAARSAKARATFAGKSERLHTTVSCICVALLRPFLFASSMHLTFSPCMMADRLMARHLPLPYLRSSCAPDTGPKTRPASISSSVRFQHIFARSTSSAPEGGLLSDCLMDLFMAMLVAMNSASDVCAGASIFLKTRESGMSNATGNPVMYRRASSSSGHGMASSAIRVRRPSTRR